MTANTLTTLPQETRDITIDLLAIYAELVSGKTYLTEDLMIGNNLHLPDVLNMAVGIENSKLFSRCMLIMFKYYDVDVSKDKTGIVDLMADGDMIFATKEGFKVDINHIKLANTHHADVIDLMGLSF